MGYFPYASTAKQSWVKNSKPAILIRDHGRYLRIDARERAAKLAEWNRPVRWPLPVLGGGALLAALAAWRNLKRRERMNARGELLAE
jgi:hypothetical protein